MLSMVQVLGKRQADGDSLMRVEALRDGIVAFEDEADSQRYASLLEAEGTKVRHFHPARSPSPLCITTTALGRTAEGLDEGDQEPAAVFTCYNWREPPNSWRKLQ